MSDQYARAKELFLEAITRTEEERDAFLVVACEGDAELIASDRDEDSLLDRNAAELIRDLEQVVNRPGFSRQRVF